MYKPHNVPVQYPTMHYFVTEMCTCVHISVTKWCIEGYLLRFQFLLTRWVLFWRRLRLYPYCHHYFLNIPATPATMSSEGDYVCTLTEASLEKAKKELNEDPVNRMGAVETFRTWIKQQPHFRCKTGRTSELKQQVFRSRLDGCFGLNEYLIENHNCITATQLWWHEYRWFSAWLQYLNC